MNLLHRNARKIFVIFGGPGKLHTILSFVEAETYNS